MSRRRHAIHLRLAAAPLLSRFPAGISSRSTVSDVDVAVPVSATTAPATPPCITARCSASEYSEIAPAHANHGGRCRFCRASAVRTARAVARAVARSRRARVQQHRPHRIRRVGGARRSASVRCWLSTISGPATEFACCHSRACPRNVASPVDWFSCASAAITCAGPLPPSATLLLTVTPPLVSAAVRRSAGPCRLHVAMRKGVARLLRYIHFVRRQLQAAIRNARIQRQVQPLAVALVYRFARPWRAAAVSVAAPGLAAGCWKSTTCPSSSADCTSGAPVCALPLLVPVLLACSLLPRSLAPARRKTRFQPVAARRLCAPVAVVCSICACPVPTSVRSAESAPNVPVTSSAAIFAGTAAASPRRLSLVITTPPVP